MSHNLQVMRQPSMFSGRAARCILPFSMVLMPIQRPGKDLTFASFQVAAKDHSQFDCLIFCSLYEGDNDVFAVLVESFNTQQPPVPVSAMRDRIAETIG